jgi:succinate-semialdehyde dehydrogenase/glutarate-semialdehyde dehydrogenase
MPIASVNPATGETLRTFDTFSAAQLEGKLQRAADAYSDFRHTPFSDRVRWMLRAAEILETDKERFGRMMTEEMGKTLRSAKEEAVKSAWGCRYYAENAERLLADEPVATNASRSYIRYQPIGPVLAVMPWNFPFWQVFRFAAPSLMAGNVGLLKHASNVPQCALAIEEIFREAGFPEGVFQTLLIDVHDVARVIGDPRVRAVTLTGSEMAGSRVAAEAGSKIKKSVLELGGSDPFIVMPSADLETTAQIAVRARMINNGQSCIAAKRFIVAQEVADRFEKLFVDQVRSLRVGDPMDDATDIGPLATPQIVRDLEDQIQRSVAAGARLCCGGKRIEGPGNYLEPTVLADISKECPAYSEELFGPVATLFRVRGLDEAIQLANDSSFGLGSSLWSKDRDEQARFIDGIEAGLAFVNGMVVSDPRLPFGGVKASGYGRELSVYGIREFVNVKTVWIQDVQADDGVETE